MRAALIGTLMCAGAFTMADAATLDATPANVADVFARAKGGDTIVLTGDFSAFTLTRRSFEPALTVDARKSTVTAWSFFSVSGVTWKGGTIKPAGVTTVKSNGKLVYGNGFLLRGAEHIEISDAQVMGPSDLADGVGIGFLDSKDVKVRNCTFVNLNHALAFGRTNGFVAAQNQFTHMRSDGIDVGSAWHGLIEENKFGGTEISGQEHPDGIQMFSRPTSPPTSDIVVRRNVVTGNTQGIFMGNHARKNAAGEMVDDGGFDRITIVDNDIYVNAFQGIAADSVRSLVVTGNHIRTQPGAPHRASLNILGSTDVKRSGNVVEAGAGKAGQND